MDDDPQLKILQMVQEGTITPEEGERLLAALTAPAPKHDKPAPPTALRPAPETTAKTETPPVPAGPPNWWQQTWLILLMLCVSLFVGMAILTDNLLDGGAKLGWLACTVPLCLLGLLFSGLVWWANRSRWLHLRVLNRERQIRISLPLPLRPAAWLLRLVRPWVPALEETSIDELILSLEEVGGTDGPLTVLVDDEDGERVEVSIG